MALRRWVCVLCDKEFQAGDWNCIPGQLHMVATKTYYMDDAPHDKRDCKNSRLTILGIIPPQKVIVGDTVQESPGRNVEFVRGQYTTQDPHEQMRLDEYRTVSKARWEEVYFSDLEKMEIEKRVVAAERLRLEAERNELLAQVKKLKKLRPELAEAQAGHV